MKKISLSKIWERNRKRKYVIIFAELFLAFFLVQFLITDNSNTKKMKGVDAEGSGDIVIVKSLLPVERGGVANVTFNPYALQINDVIKVVIKVKEVKYNSNLTITDEPLKIPRPPYKEEGCIPFDAGSAYPPVSPLVGSSTFISPTQDSVVWFFTSPNSGGNEYEFQYYCKVGARS